LQNAPFKMSQTASTNRTAGPRIGEHTREVLERLLGMTREEIVAGYDDGTFWPTERERFDYHEEMLK
jgi:crotonobetainyl-CoA:carnitine CoA-transferase CaiB-like acyl-CoA transferase